MKNNYIDNLSERLKAIYEMVPHGSRLCDVGCDHGYLSIALVSSGKCPSAICCDVRPGPLKAAKQHIREAELKIQEEKSGELERSDEQEKSCELERSDKPERSDEPERFVKSEEYDDPEQSDKSEEYDEHGQSDKSEEYDEHGQSDKSEEYDEHGQSVESEKLCNKFLNIETRLSDGLSKIRPEECDTVVIAGMGGPLTVRILQNASDSGFFDDLYRNASQKQNNSKSLADDSTGRTPDTGDTSAISTDMTQDTRKTLILEPQSKVDVVRYFLFEHGFNILDEDMVYEDGKYYQIIKASAGQQKAGQVCHTGQAGYTGQTCHTGQAGYTGQTCHTRQIDHAEEFSEMQLKYGPVLMKKRHPVLIQYLSDRKNKLIKIYENLLSINSSLSEEITDQKSEKSVRQVDKYECGDGKTLHTAENDGHEINKTSRAAEIYREVSQIKHFLNEGP